MGMMVFLPGCTVMIVFEVTVAIIQLRKLSKVTRASAMKRTKRKYKHFYIDFFVNNTDFRKPINIHDYTCSSLCLCLKQLNDLFIPTGIHKINIFKWLTILLMYFGFTNKLAAYHTNGYDFTVSSKSHTSSLCPLRPSDFVKNFSSPTFH